MHLLEIIGENNVSERQVGLLFLPTLEDLPLSLHLQGQYFGLCLACDARQIPDHHIVEVADSLLRQGLAYICCWGPDCERVHDLFDGAIIENDPHETDKSVRLTSWLADSSLAEAIWEFLNVAFPADQYKDDCQTELFIAIGEEEWAIQIRMWIADQKRLNRTVLDIDDETAA